jgi:hypothetical protein
VAQREYENFSARRRVDLESAGELETLKHIEDQIEKRPKSKKPKPPKK